MNKLRRLSLVVFIDEDEATAKQIQDSIVAFTKRNFKISDDNIQSFYRTVPAKNRGQNGKE